MPTDPEEDPLEARPLLVLCAAAVAGGAATGLLGGAFRWSLQHADRMRLDLVHRAAGLPAGWLVPLVLAALGAALARAIVRPVPLAAGSGVQEVEAVWREEAAPPSPAIIPAKFVGGVVAIGSGLVLGREGPTVHMGAAVATLTGRVIRLPEEGVRVLQTALGGAGLAVAFNAPMGGALFAMEEVARVFRVRLATVSLLGCGTAVACSRLLLGDRPDFLVVGLHPPPAPHLAVYALFGLATGVLGVLYQRLILGVLRVADRVRGVPPEVRAAVIGAMVGLLVWFAPLTVGGGDVVTQKTLSGGVGLLAAGGYLGARFLAGPISYAAGTPGGLFAPLLAIGALWGTIVHAGVHAAWPAFGDSAAPLVAVGMVAFFVVVVRAPLTGIVLISEMTATTSLLVPMALAAAAAALVATMFRSPPIYDSLRLRMLGDDGRAGARERDPDLPGEPPAAGDAG
jgi:CIC family chloride channel protein